MNRHHFFLCVVFAFAMASPALPAAEHVNYTSTAERQAVLELFTSEGCSSCPPAEEWLSTLSRAEGLWTKFVPIAFHVDYWDYLGWKDVYASKETTQRQHQYAATWRSNRVYTPGFVLNGEEWQGRSLALPKAEKVGVLTLSGDHAKGLWSTHFKPVAGAAEGLIYHVALVGSATSKVTAGENAGRTLKHDFVVLSHAGSSSANGGASVKLGADTRASAVVAWVSRGADPTPLQAVGGPL